MQDWEIDHTVGDAIFTAGETFRRYKKPIIAAGGVYKIGKYLYDTMRTRSGKRYRPNAGVNRRTRYRGATSYGSTRTARARPAGVRSGMGVTVQHDARRIYSKRRMPRGMRKRWKRFSKKVLAVSEKDLGSRTVVFNKLQQYSNSTSGSHGLAYCALYSASGSGDSFMKDLNNLSTYENRVAPSHTVGDTTYDTTKWIFKSAILDLTVRNASTYNNAGSDVASADAKLEVDVYELISKREWADATTMGPVSDITGCFSYGATITPTLNDTGGPVGVVLTQRGVTPWDLPAALGAYRLKILKKTKYFLNNGDQFTYQIRDPKRRVVMNENIDKAEGGNKPGWTRHVLMIYKLVPGLTVGTDPGTYKEKVDCGITRKYFYKITGMNEDRDRYIAG